VGDRDGQFATFRGFERTATLQRGFELAGRRITHALGRADVQLEFAVAVLHDRIVHGASDARAAPGPRLLPGVLARLVIGADGDARVEVGHDQLRDERAQRHPGCLLRTGADEDILLRDGDGLELHGAAVGLLLAEGVSVRAHPDAGPTRQRGRDHEALRGPVPAGDDHAAGAHRTGREALGPDERPPAFGLVLGRDRTRIERVERIAPEQALRDRLLEPALLWAWVPCSSNVAICG
jgi:hypothetical protein